MTVRTTYNGDEHYSVPCAGYVVIGDEIAWTQPMWSNHRGDWSVYSHTRHVGKVMGECISHGHPAFRVWSKNGQVVVRKATLTKNGVWRRPWVDESKRGARVLQPYEAQT